MRDTRHGRLVVVADMRACFKTCLDLHVKDVGTESAMYKRKLIRSLSIPLS